MKITMPMILDQLNHVELECNLINDEMNAGISGARFFNEYSFSVKADILYLIRSSLLQDIAENDLPKNIICIKDTDIQIDVNQFKRVNLIIIKGYSDLNLLLEELQNVIMDYQRIYNEMIKMVTENKDLVVIVSRISEIIGNPIYVADADFKILALADCKLKNPEAWQYIIKNGIENGYISSSVNDFYFMKDLINKIGNEKKPVFFSGNALYPNAFYSMSLKSNNKSIGLVTVFETEKPFSLATKDLIEYLKDFLILEIQKDQAVMINEGVKLGHLFAAILNSEFNSVNEMKKVINYLNFSFPKDFFIMVVKSNLSYENTYELAFLRKNIMGIVKNSICIIFQDSIVLLANDKSENQLKGQRNLELQKWLKDSKMVTGISKNYSEITEIIKAYKEALMAIEIGKKAKDDDLIFYYNSLRFLHLIDVIANIENVEDLCHPALNKLVIYDENKGSNLVETLYCYIKNSQSQAQTAKTLHMHRSSLQYRLNKIEEIMGICLHDYQVFLHLQLTFEILKQRRKVGIVSKIEK